MRTVKTSSGATAVQIVWSWRKGSRSIEHLGSAHNDVELVALKAAAAERLAAGQTELDLGISGTLEPGTLPILSSQMSHLWEALCAAYRILRFDSATKGDNVFRDLVLARIIEPTSKIDAERVLSEVGAGPASYASVSDGLCTGVASETEVTVVASERNRNDIVAANGHHWLTNVAVTPGALGR